MIYRFRPESRISPSVDPEAAYARIANLREQGRSTPGDIVEDARPEGSTLHDAFTWDDGEAAEKFRLQEARHLCSAIIVIRDEDTGSPGSELAHLRWDPLSLAERRLQMADMWAGAAEKRRASKAKPAAKAEEAK
jgi:hypothetical protein